MSNEQIISALISVQLPKYSHIARVFVIIRQIRLGDDRQCKLQPWRIMQFVLYLYEILGAPRHTYICVRDRTRERIGLPRPS